MRKKKRGVSVLIATVLLILIVVAAAGIIWAVVMPMMQQAMQLKQACMKAILRIDQDNTYIMGEYLKVAVERGSEEFEIEEIAFSVEAPGVAKIVFSSSEEVINALTAEQLKTALGPLEKHTFTINLIRIDMLPEEVTSVAVAPRVRIGKAVRTCDVTDKISNIMYEQRLIKKIIYSGWDSPPTDFVRENWQEMDKVPLDGVSLVIKIDRNATHTTGNSLGWNLGSNRIFKIEDFREAIKDMEKVRFKNLTDIFLTMQPNSGFSRGLTWFDDKRWNIFLNNIEVITKIAKEIKAVGLIIDFEGYGYSLFHWPTHYIYYSNKSWEEYYDKAFERGNETIRRINKIFPNIKIYFYYSWDMIIRELTRTGGNLSKSGYGLMLPYLEGLLYGADNRTIFYNGYEYSYSYKDRRQFERAKKEVMEGGIKLTRYPEKFAKQVKMGYGLWLDYRGKWNTTNFTENYFTPEEFENSLRFALNYSDRYVWIYSQQARFFRSPNIPESYLKAIEEVRKESKK